MAERAFRLPRTGGDVPGVLWLPPGAAGVVLVGHGGSGHKRSDRVRGLAAAFASSGLATVAIDGPFHGERAAGDHRARMLTEGVEKVLDRVTTEWQATIDALADEVDTDRMGYLGMSMGTRFGLPLAAALGDRLRAAVLGKFGLRSTLGLDTPGRVERDAQQVTAPTLFHVQWDDEVFPRGGQLELFYVLGAAEKRMLTFPGGHAETPPQAILEWRNFLAERLRQS